MFTFDLSEWQKKAIKAIETGNHCLVTAPTGSGKTVPAEYAIHYFTQLSKKIIYTSPIKALSNQKYYEFREKFPNTTFGILTGDIKDNPEADVLIMTTEILCNYLHNLNNKSQQLPLEFNINMETELGCVIFDEVHYINDKDRGTVWEECFMLMPQHIQLVMLSATISNSINFARWIEDLSTKENKKVFLCDTNIRAVPLKHYLWFASSPQMINKKITDRKMNLLIHENTNRLLPISDTNTAFYEKNYYTITNIKDHLTYNKIFLKRTHILNSLVTHLHTNTMLPAICFIYSRKNVEKFANEITTTLIDSTTINKIQKECRHILTKFDNYKEYLNLPEYSLIVKLLEKGIAIHHAGLLPVFREMIELLFTKGYIKFLFATETFAVGLNMPTKTVVFSDLQKFDGYSKRYLYSHEYTQQSGRAGRRGFDTVGHVIHLTNIFDLPEIQDYKLILSNKSQEFISKFKISYSLILHLLSNTTTDNPFGFVSNSIINNDINKEINYTKNLITSADNNIQKQQYILDTSCQIPINEIKTIIELENTISMYKNKQRKQKQREIDDFKYTYKKYEQEKLTHKKLIYYMKEKDNYIKQLENTENYISYQINSIKSILSSNNFINLNELTDIGKKAISIKETHSLVLVDVLEEFNNFKEFTVEQIISYLSCFTNINVSDELKITNPYSNNNLVLNVLKYTHNRMDYYYNEEIKHDIYSGANYDIQYNIIDNVYDWCSCSTETESISFLSNLKNEKGIFIGEFTKAILKINNIKNELKKLCITFNHLELLSKLEQIPEKILKFVCTPQSLYV